MVLPIPNSPLNILRSLENVRGKQERTIGGYGVNNGRDI